MGSSEPATVRDERGLLEQARRSPTAFGALYDLHLGAVYRACLAQARTREQAEQLTEETFTRALDALTLPGGAHDRWPAGTEASAWLLALAAEALRRHGLG